MPRSGNLKKEDKAMREYPDSGDNKEGGQGQQRDPQYFSEVGRKGGQKTQEDQSIGGQGSGGSTMPDEEE